MEINEALVKDAIFKFYKTNNPKQIISSYKKSLSMDFDDILQIGRIAYVKAVNNYKEGAKASLVTYAYRIIHNELGMLGRASIAQQRSIYSYTTSIHLPVGDENVTLEEILPDTTTQAVEFKLDFEAAMGQLEETDKLLMQMQLKGHNMTEIANTLGISRRGGYEKLKMCRRKLKHILGDGYEYIRT